MAIQTSLKDKVSDFMVGNSWSIPSVLASKSPIMFTKIKSMHIPVDYGEDFLIWKHNDSGVLSFKDAYIYVNHDAQAVGWGNLIWSSIIPPSRSFLLWRLLHNKLPTDENLK